MFEARVSTIISIVVSSMIMLVQASNIQKLTIKFGDVKKYNTCTLHASTSKSVPHIHSVQLRFEGIKEASQQVLLFT